MFSMYMARWATSVTFCARAVSSACGTCALATSPPEYYEEDLYINGLHLVHGGARIFASFFCGSQCAEPISY